MMNKNVVTFLITIGFLFVGNSVFSKVVMDDIKLPEPQMENSMPLMEALQKRKSSVKFAKTEIPLQTISNLLWAANGENRPDGKRTTPSALNTQNISIFVTMEDGLYRYNPKMHELEAFSREDVRPLIGIKAPLTLLYVANLSRQSKYLSSVDCGFIAQNVYLYSAANNLNTVFLYGINATAINLQLDFGLGQEVLFAQVVGYAP